MAAPERVRLLQDIFTSWGSECCDKILLLAESFHDCPHWVSFLVKEENEKGIIYILMMDMLGLYEFKTYKQPIHKLSRLCTDDLSPTTCNLCFTYTDMEN